jgi:predicted nucleic acid-binding protein
VATAPLWAGLRGGSTVLVDSAPLIYWLEGHPVFAERFAGLFQAAASGDLHVALSTITLAEVLTGPYQAGQTALARRYENALQQYRIVDITPAIAILGAQLRAQYRLKLPDALQLACALDMGADALVTHDRDFSRVSGVLIVTGD